MEMERACRQIIKEILDGRIRDKTQLQLVKQRVAKEFSLSNIPRDPDILSYAKPDEKPFLSLLSKKPTRTLSGVSVVAVMTPPWPCPGKCIYCPRGDAAQSYTGQEPAAMRARENQFDPESQVKNRIFQLSEIGHPTDKVEIIVMGGTFTAMPRDKQQDFVLGIFAGLNGERHASIEEAHLANEKAKHRCIGMTFEVRPDFCKKEHISRMLEYGGTRVELGVQSVFDDVLSKVRRGHGVSETVVATQLLKDSAFKVCYHLMPGLPGSSREKDLKMFETIFSDSRFMPDMLKIYPTVLTRREFYKDDQIWDMYKSGDWKPLSNEDAVDLLAHAMEYVPRWVRIMRMQRDIPARLIEAGVTAGNLRELVYKRARELGIRILEVREREVGIRVRNGYEIGEPKLLRTEYEASGGYEIFIEFCDDEDTLFGFLRLRKPFNPFRPEISQDTALVRELHVYGPEAEIGERDYRKVQHMGLGRALLYEAERVAREEWDCKDILVISGVGVRPYYRKLGYRRLGPYMGKAL